MPRARRIDILLIGSAGAVLLFLLRSAGQTPDGLSYALAARAGTDLFHPHHLLYVPVTRLVHLLTGSRDPLVAGVLHNLAWLLVLGWAAWRLALARGWGHGAALLAAGVLLASRGVIFYATHVETYLPAVACVAMFMADRFGPRPRAGVAACWLALAVLYHQTNVLLVLPFLVASARPRSDFGRVVLPAGLAVLALYLVAWRLTPAAPGFVPWLLSYARADVPAWGSVAHFGLAGWRDLGANQVRMLLPVPVAAVAPAAVAFWSGLAGLVVHHLRRSDRRRERRFGLVFLAAYLPFFLWWIPSDPDFFLVTLLPLWWLGMLLLADLPARWRGRWWLGIAALLLAGNLVFVALPMHRDPGPGRARAEALDRIAPRGAALVVGYGLEQELRYHTTRDQVWEGDALGWRVAAGAALPGSPAEVVIGADYLQLLLQRRSANDLALLRALLAYDAATATCRAYGRLPDGLGLLIGAAVVPAPAWEVLLDELAQPGKRSTSY